MKHTNDEIEIKITKKDRIYLSIILSLILVVSLVCVLVPRYYYIKYANTTPTPSVNSSTPTEDNNSSNNNSNADSSSSDNSNSNTNASDNSSTNNPSTEDNTNTDDNCGVENENNSAQEDFLTTTNFTDSYSTKVINKLVTVNTYYKNSYSKFLDTQNILNTQNLNLTAQSFANLESYAQIIYNLIKDQTTLTDEYIMNNDELVSNINYFKNLLNDLEK